MSRYFVLDDPQAGPGGTIYWRKHKGAPEGWYRLYVGTVFFGQVIKTSTGEWSAITWNNCHESEFFPHVVGMDGFRNRWYASVFIIKTWGYHMKMERESKDRWDHREEIIAGIKAKLDTP